MLQYAGLPEAFWAEALLTSAHIRNIVPMKGKTRSPYEFFMGQSLVSKYKKLVLI